MRFGRFKRLYACAIVCLLLAACSGSGDTASTADEKSYYFRLAETHPNVHPTTRADKKFAELVNERSNGRIHIEVFPSSQLGEEKAAIEQLQQGAIEFIRTSGATLAEYAVPFGVFSIPYLFRNDDHLWRYLDSDAGIELLDGLDDAGITGLAYYSSGARSLYSVKEIESVHDLKGMNIRVQQNQISIDFIQALGANAIPMTYGEVYGALNTGVIDAAENNPPSYYSSNHYKIASQFVLNEHQRIPDVLVMSQAVWNRLSEDDKALIKQAAIDSSELQQSVWNTYEQDAASELEKAGVHFAEIADTAEWQQAALSVLQKYSSAYKEQLADISALAKAEDE